MTPTLSHLVPYSMEENKSLKRRVVALKKEAARYASALTTMKKTVNEVNLFNARLRGATRLMNEVTMTRKEKNSVMDRFDDCESVREVKRTFKALKEAYRASSRVRNQRTNRNVQSVKNTLTESNEQFTRLQELANVL